MLRDLTRFRGLASLLHSAWPWRLLQIAGLLVLLAMIAAGWHHHGIPGVAVSDPLMYTNLATYLFWVLWMMGVVPLALVLGRAWCTVCPLGWLNGLVARMGLGWPLPRWLDNFIPVTLTLVALQVAVYLLAIHRYPDYTAVLLVLVLATALGLGLLFRKRSFCSLLCPAGAVFGLYARVAPLQLRVKCPETCAACDSQDCISGAEQWRRLSFGRAQLFWPSRRRDCPAGLVPAQLQDSADCTLCLHCLQNCEKGNILLGRRSWLGDFGQRGLRPSEAFFFVVLLGLLTANFSKVYLDLREALLWLPQRAAEVLGWQVAGFELLAALWVSLGLPLLLVLPGWLLLRLSGVQVADVDGASLAPPSALPPSRQSEGFWACLGRLTLPLVPLLLAAHLVLALVKLNAKGVFLPLVLADPSGVRSYLAVNVMQVVPPPGVLVPIDLLKWVALLLLTGGYLAGLTGAWKMARGGAGGRGFLPAAALNLTLLLGIYVITLIHWLFLR